MTHTTHTQGPWALDETANGWTLLANGGEITADHFDCSKEDARLIAAAPDLLAALENLTVLFDRIDRSGATNKAAYNDAIAAITKAKGN